MKTDITPSDILSLDEYEKIRDDQRAAVRAANLDRRIEVGPFANFVFENYNSLWLQIHEMLRIEKGGDPQITDELAAYNPMMPKGRDLTATLMFEIADPDRRDTALRKMGGIEAMITLSFGEHTVTAEPDDDIERTRQDGKTSAVHFLHFRFTDEQTAAFKSADTEITLAFGHSGYRHASVLGQNVRCALAADLA